MEGPPMVSSMHHQYTPLPKHHHATPGRDSGRVVDVAAATPTTYAPGEVRPEQEKEKQHLLRANLHQEAETLLMVQP